MGVNRKQLTAPTETATMKILIKGGTELKRKLNFDKLNTALLIAAAVFFILRSTITLVLAGVCIALVIIRSVSHDYAARQRENDIFENFFARQKAKAQSTNAKRVRRIRPVYQGQAGESSIGNQKEKSKSDGNYKVFRCPKCKQMLRLPKNVGKVRVTCSNCGHAFDKKA